MGKVRHYRELLVWQKAMDLVSSIYGLTSAWPKEELFGLTSQCRRSAVSVPSNIAEGHGRRSDREFARFLLIAHGSLMELQTQLEIAHRLTYSSAAETRVIISSCNETGRLIHGLYRRTSRNPEPN